MRRHGSVEIGDLDVDGREEVLLAHDGQVLTVDPAEGAGIGSWDIRAARHALAGVLRRRPEAYHATIVDVRGPEGEDAPDEAAPARSIHDPAPADPGLAEHLVYDGHERRSGLVRFLDVRATPVEWASARVQELGDFVDGEFDLWQVEPERLGVARLGEVETPDGPIAVLVERVLTVGGSRLAPTLAVELSLTNRGAVGLKARVGLEWATTMLGGGGNPAAWWDCQGERTRHDAAGSATAVTELGQGNDHVGIAVTSTLSPAGDAWWAPIETISNSESGFERAYQGAGLLLSWPIEVEPGQRASYRVEHVVAVRADKAAEEAEGWWPPFRPIP
jgi:alpha-amylase